MTSSSLYLLGLFGANNTSYFRQHKQKNLSWKDGKLQELVGKLENQTQKGSRAPQGSKKPEINWWQSCHGHREWKIPGPGREHPHIELSLVPSLGLQGSFGLLSPKTRTPR